jgi:hypothetical protein
MGKTLHFLHTSRDDTAGAKAYGLPPTSKVAGFHAVTAVNHDSTDPTIGTWTVQ